MTNPGAPGIFGPPRPICDLIFSTVLTVLTLVVVPTLYALFAEKPGVNVV